MKILVAEPVSPAGVELLKAQAGWDVVVSDPKGYAAHLHDCDALLVRSAVKVNADVLAKAPKLRVIGRAGVGVDNVDLPAATAAGVLVMNTPGGNAVSVAEHTLGFMLSMARSIPDASASTKAGKWEKKKFMGNELRGKTLGVLGLGSIGREVVTRAKPFGMRVVAYDPFVNPQVAADMGVELGDLDSVYAQADYVTVHVALTKETEKMLNAAAFAKMKKGARIVNCARGELLDSAALVAAIQSGHIAGAALDVFEKEPPAADDPILGLPTVLATPHIGGSTEEAQEIVGVRIAEQMVEYLQNGVALNAVNMPAMSPAQYKAVGPFVTLAERLGQFAAQIAEGNPKSVRMIYTGRIADMATQLLLSAGLAGVLHRSAEGRVNLVNARQIAADRGLAITELHQKGASQVDGIRIELETGGGVTSVEGAVVLDKPRLIQVDGVRCEASLGGHVVFMKNHDVPGVIGYVGGVLGKSGVNIASFSLGRADAAAESGKPLSAVAVVETDSAVSEAVLAELLSNPAVRLARPVEFPA